MAKLSKAQQTIINALLKDHTAYVYPTDYWNHQTLVTENGTKRKDFNRATREVLQREKIILKKDGEKDKLVLAPRYRLILNSIYYLDSFDNAGVYKGVFKDNKGSEYLGFAPIGKSKYDKIDGNICFPCNEDYDYRDV